MVFHSDGRMMHKDAEWGVDSWYCNRQRAWFKDYWFYDGKEVWLMRYTNNVVVSTL